MTTLWGPTSIPLTTPEARERSSRTRESETVVTVPPRSSPSLSRSKSKGNVAPRGRSIASLPSPKANDTAGSSPGGNPIVTRAERPDPTDASFAAPARSDAVNAKPRSTARSASRLQPAKDKPSEKLHARKVGTGKVRVPSGSLDRRMEGNSFPNGQITIQLEIPRPIAPQQVPELRARENRHRVVRLREPDGHPEIGAPLKRAVESDGTLVIYVKVVLDHVVLVAAEEGTVRLPDDRALDDAPASDDEDEIPQAHDSPEVGDGAAREPEVLVPQAEVIRLPGAEPPLQEQERRIPRFLPEHRVRIRALRSVEVVVARPDVAGADARVRPYGLEIVDLAVESAIVEEVGPGAVELERVPLQGQPVPARAALVPLEAQDLRMKRERFSAEDYLAAGVERGRLRDAGDGVCRGVEDVVAAEDELERGLRIVRPLARDLHRLRVVPPQQRVREAELAVLERHGEREGGLRRHQPVRLRLIARGLEEQVCVVEIPERQGGREDGAPPGEADRRRGRVVGPRRGRDSEHERDRRPGGRESRAPPDMPPSARHQV